MIYDDKYFYAKICYAEYKGVWAFGYRYEYKGSGVGCGGGGCLPSFNEIRKDPIPVQSKEVARTAALNLLLTRCFRKDHPYGKSVHPVLSALKKALNPQLSLF